MEKTITGYEEAKDALLVASMRQALYDNDKILLKDAVVNLHGEEHGKKRRVLQGVLRRKFFREYQNHIFPNALNETLTPYIRSGRGDMVEFAYRILVNLVADTAGVDRQCTTEDTDKLLSIIKRFSHAPTLGQLVSGDQDAMLEDIQSALDDFEREFYKPSLERRKKLIAEAESDPSIADQVLNDVLTVMLKHYNDTELPSDVRMKDCAFFILAGAFTVANALCNVIYEILTWINSHPGSREELLSDPPMLQRFIWESLRLHPPTPFMKRRAICPVHLNSNIDMAENDTVDIDIKTANRDKSVFGEDSEIFNPYRKLPKQIPLYGLSFGYGAHVCLGRVLAAGVEITDANIDVEETEYGTLYMAVHALLELGIDWDPDDPVSIDDSTLRKHFLSIPFVLKKA